MTYFEKVASFGQTIEASENADSIVKVAEENGVTRNDLIVHHNLTSGNIFTGENLVKVAEDEAESPLLVAVAAYEKLASDQITADEAYEMAAAAGLEPQDLEDVADLIDKQASEAGVVATGEVWEKIAEAYEYLDEFGLDPVTALEFAQDFSDAETAEDQDKVASEFDGLDEESIDKIAEVVDYLADIENADLPSLMAEFEKEAGVKEMAAKAGRTLSGADHDAAKKAQKAYNRLGVVTGKQGKAIGVKSFGKSSKKSVQSAVDSAGRKKHMARGAAAAGVGAGAVGAAALSKQASDGVIATDEVWEKIAEAHDFLSELGLDPVSSIEFAEEFTAATDEEGQDKVASEFDGLDEESIDKIAEAFEYLSDIEGASLSDLMDEMDKEAGVREMAGKLGRTLSGADHDAAKKAQKAYNRLGVVTGKQGKAIGVKSFGKSSKKSVQSAVDSAGRKKNLARAGVAGAAGAAGTAAYASR